MQVKRQMLSARNLAKTFYLPRGKRIDAVCGVSFSVSPGEIYGLLGPNGAGKTTLLRMLATILEPTSGTCEVAGICARERPVEVRRRIGFLSGNTKLYSRLTVREVLRYFGQLYGLNADTIAAKTLELAKVLGMEELLDRRCEGFSTGQLQKVSIARVLLHDPPVLILDEPTLGLDIMTSKSILEFIQQAKALGRCVLFSTHYMTEAEALCDRIGLIYQGRLLAEGTQESLYEQTGSRNLQEAFLSIVSKQGEAVE